MLICFIFQYKCVLNIIFLISHHSGWAVFQLLYIKTVILDFKSIYCVQIDSALLSFSFTVSKLDVYILTKYICHGIKIGQLLVEILEKVGTQSQMEEEEDVRELEEIYSQSTRFIGLEQLENGSAFGNLFLSSQRKTEQGNSRDSAKTQEKERNATGCTIQKDQATVYASCLGMTSV